MKKAGRPKGTCTLPPEYWGDLAVLLALWKPDKPGRTVVYYGPPDKPLGKISQMCEHIVKNGGVKWIDRSTGKIVHDINDKDELRSRYYDAWQKAQQERQAFQRMSPTITYASTFTATSVEPIVWPTVVSRSEFKLSSSSSSSRRTALQIGKKLHNK